MHDAPTSRSADRNRRRRQLATGTLLLLFALVALAPGIGFGTRLGLFGAGDTNVPVPDAASSAADHSGEVATTEVPAGDLLPDLYPELPADVAAAAVAATGQSPVSPALPAPPPLLERELVEAVASAQDIAPIPEAAGPDSPVDNALLTWTGHPEYVASAGSRSSRGAIAGFGGTGGSSGLPSGYAGGVPGTDILTNAPGAGVSSPGAKNRDGNEDSDGPGNGPSLPEQVPDFVPDLTGNNGQPGDLPTGETGNGGTPGGGNPPEIPPAPGSALPGSDLNGDVVQVPEPGTFTLLALGLLGCFAARGRRPRA